MSAENTLLRFLVESGFGSRRKMAAAIKNGLVRVNGVVVEDFRLEIHPPKDIVTFSGQEVPPSKKQMIYLMMNKPPGIITTTSDEKGRKNVMDLVPREFENMRLYPVGRLDRDSTGLLLLTNDGELTYRLTHPKFEHEREYLVAIDGLLDERDRRKLESGVDLADGRTHHARVKLSKKTPPFNYSIIIHEGRNRQVRRMFESLGYKVRRLKRVRMGKLRLGNLNEGEVRALTAQEISRFFPSLPY